MSDPALTTATAFVAEREGFRANPYRDGGGVWTIGYGFTVTADGQHVRADTPPITQVDAYARLTGMVGRVLALVRGSVHVPITDNQAAALTSLAYNIGTVALRNSTLLRLLNDGDVQGAADQFGAWIYCDSRPNKGLANRRAMERALFLTPDGPDADDLNAAQLASITQE